MVGVRVRGERSRRRSPRRRARPRRAAPARRRLSTPRTASRIRIGEVITSSFASVQAAPRRVSTHPDHAHHAPRRRPGPVPPTHDVGQRRAGRQLRQPRSGRRSWPGDRGVAAVTAPIQIPSICSSSSGRSRFPGSVMLELKLPASAVDWPSRPERRDRQARPRVTASTRAQPASTRGLRSSRRSPVSTSTRPASAVAPSQGKNANPIAPMPAAPTTAGTKAPRGPRSSSRGSSARIGPSSSTNGSAVSSLIAPIWAYAYTSAGVAASTAPAGGNRPRHRRPASQVVESRRAEREQQRHERLVEPDPRHADEPTRCRRAACGRRSDTASRSSCRACAGRQSQGPGRSSAHVRSGNPRRPGGRRPWCPADTPTASRGRPGAPGPPRAGRQQPRRRSAMHPVGPRADAGNQQPNRPHRRRQAQPGSVDLSHWEMCTAQPQRRVAQARPAQAARRATPAPTTRSTSRPAPTARSATSAGNTNSATANSIVYVFEAAGLVARSAAAAQAEDRDAGTTRRRSGRRRSRASRRGPRAAPRTARRSRGRPRCRR